MTLVVDASVAVEYLLRTRLGEAVASRIEAEDLIAPELLDAEVLAVLRRAVLTAGLTVERAQMAITDLVRWDLQRLAHRFLVHEA